jgi:hypothetical protein
MFRIFKVTLTRLPNLEARGAPGSDDTKCDSFSGSGGVIVINGTIYGGTPYPESDTSPIPKGKKSKSYGVVLINGNMQDLFAGAFYNINLGLCNHEVLRPFRSPLLFY